MSRILKRETLWKAVENAGAVRPALQSSVNSTARFFHKGVSAGPPMGACSACAGDYEDPDRTAGPPDKAEDEECDEAADTATEAIPVDE